VAKRYKIGDFLVAADEPGAVRRVKGHSEPSIRIRKIEDKEEDLTEEAEEAEEVEAAEAADAASPEVEEPKTEAKVPAAKGAKKK